MPMQTMKSFVPKGFLSLPIVFMFRYEFFVVIDMLGYPSLFRVQRFCDHSNYSKTHAMRSHFEAPGTSFLRCVGLKI